MGTLIGSLLGAALVMLIGRAMKGRDFLGLAATMWVVGLVFGWVATSSARTRPELQRQLIEAGISADEFSLVVGIVAFIATAVPGLFFVVLAQAAPSRRGGAAEDARIAAAREAGRRDRDGRDAERLMRIRLAGKVARNEITQAEADAALAAGLREMRGEPEMLTPGAAPNLQAALAGGVSPERLAQIEAEERARLEIRAALEAELRAKGGG